jgi:uncharacterized protein YgbK (DUF1537 family)
MRRARERLARLGRALVFKKIDSTLRGNVLTELANTGAWIAPAYPEMGRQLIGGRLVVNGVRCGTALETAPGLRICDAEKQADLSAVADEAFAMDPRPLLAGSGGLAIEVARRLGNGVAKPRIPGRPGPAVLYIGSTHAVTLAQVAWLKVHRDLHSYRLVRAQTLEGVLAAPIARYQGREAAGVIMTGGDTAAMVCEILGVRGIRLIREALPGIPYGTLLGGRLDGVPVITKSGGFGGEDALALLVDALREGLS